MLLGTTGCGLFGGSSNEASGDTGGPVEKPKIKIGVIPSIGMAPLYLAVSKGYFKQEGLDAQLVPMPGDGGSMSSLLGGDVDFTFASYPLLVQAEQKGEGRVKLEIVADAAAARPDMTAVVVKKDSPLRNAADLEDRTIAVPSTRSIADLAVMAGMKAARADTSGIKWKVMDSAAMLPKLQSGDIDAAFLVEPFLSVAQTQLGVWTVFQPTVGRLDGIGLDAYAALEKTTKAYPKTVAAFQRAVYKANRAAATPEGQNALRQELMSKIRIRPEIAALVHLPAYPLTTEPTRLQRVPDLMHEFGLLKQPFDIGPMILES
jgi:NitT/TauT family transport system substrate-binding protein